MINKNFFTSNPSLHKSHYATRQLPTTLVVLRYIRVNTSAVVPLHCLCLYWRFFFWRAVLSFCALYPAVLDTSDTLILWRRGVLTLRF
jgi:hypothetical protein